MGATVKVAVVSQRKTQKVQALTRFVQLDDLRFLAVDGEPKVGLDDGTLQPHADQLQHGAVGDPSFQTLDQCIMRNRIKVRFHIRA